MTNLKNLVTQEGPRRFSATAIKAADGSKRSLFVWLDPDGNPRLILDADTAFDAWVMATGWGDQPYIDDLAKQGWRLLPCKVAWNGETGEPT